MTYPDPQRGHDQARLPRVLRSTSIALAIVAGAAPWVATAMALLWP